MGLIPLRDRSRLVIAHALVDDEDLDRVMAQGRWCLDHYGYVVKMIDHRIVKLHRFVLGLTAPTPGVDHWDRDPLNNQKGNLRLCDSALNNQNQNSAGRGRSGVRGVSWDKNREKWRVQHKLNGVRYHLGMFASLEEAGAVASAWRHQHMPFSEESRWA